MSTCDKQWWKKELEPLFQDDNETVRLRAAAGYLRLSAIEAGARMKRRSAAVPSSAAQAAARVNDLETVGKGVY